MKKFAASPLHRISEILEVCLNLIKLFADFTLKMIIFTLYLLKHHDHHPILPAAQIAFDVSRCLSLSIIISSLQRT